MFENIGFPELVIILVVILVLFGAKRIPDLAKGIGQGIKEFKKGIKEGDDDDKPSVNDKQKEDKKEN
jgi:sec-independent protein translocase protein TatA